MRRTPPQAERSAPIVDLRRPGLGRPAAGRLRRPAAAPARDEGSPGGARSSRSSTPAAASTRGSTTWSTKGVTLDGQPIGLRRPGHRPGAARRPRRPARRGRSTRCPATARSSPAWSTRPARTPTSSPGASCRRTGPIVESDWIAALAPDRRAGRAATAPARPGGQPIDVLSLSMGYYHETPEDELFDPTLYAILEDLVAARHGRGVLGRQRRDQPAVLPGGVRALGGRRTGPVRRPGLPAGRVGRRAQPQPPHRRAVQQRRPVGPRLRAGGRGAQHDARRSRAACSRWRGPMAFGRVREAIDPDDFRRRLRRVERHVVRGAAAGRRGSRPRCSRTSTRRERRRGRPRPSGALGRSWRGCTGITP